MLAFLCHFKVLLGVLETLYLFSNLAEMAERIGAMPHVIRTLTILLRFELDQLPDRCKES